MSGKLFLVPTPIGNLKDITLRALEVLKNVDLVAAEDTRQSLKLLNHYGIKKRLVSYHQHNEQFKSENLIQELKSGNSIAIVTDAGTPGISDPGSVMVKACIEENISFEVLPGATAITTALIYSGMDTKQFIFIGFLPREGKERKLQVENLTNRKETLIFYEAPHRLIDTLEFLLQNFGDRRISLCRELTKLHEEILRFSIQEAIAYYKEHEPRGEYVLVLQGESEEEAEKRKMEEWEDLSIEEHIIKYMDKGFDKKESIKKVAKERKLSKSEVYKCSLELKRE